MPRPNQPRSPPLGAEPGSCECFLASSANRLGFFFSSARSFSASSRVLTRMWLVGRLDLGLGGRILLRQRLGRKHDVLGAHALRRAVVGLVGVVVRLDLLVGELHLREELLVRDARLRDLALLRLDRGEARGHRARRDRGLGDRAGEARERDVALQLGDVALVGDAAAREVGRVLGGGELAVLLELRRAGDGVDHRLAAHHHVGAQRLALEQAALDQALEHRAARFRRVEDARIDRAAEAPAQLLLLAAHLLGELALRDLQPVDRRDRVARAAKARIGLDAPGGEGERDQAEEHLDEALVLGDEIEHGNSSGGKPEF